MIAAIAAGARTPRAGHEESASGELTDSGGRMTVVAQSQDTTTTHETVPERPFILDTLRTMVTVVTPSQATDILARANWRRQRMVSPAWVERLRMAILKHELTFLTLVYGEYPNGARVLVDGQHRLTALALTDVTLQATIVVHRVMNEQELGDLYLKYDRSKARGPEVGLRAQGIFEESATPEGFVKRMGAAAGLVESGFDRGRRVKGSDLLWRTAAVKAWLPEIALYHDTLLDAPGETQRRLLRSAVGAVALATFRSQTGMAAKFWRRLATQDMLAADDPRYILMAWLRNNNAKSAKYGVVEVVQSLYVAGAWNAFFEGRKLKILKVADPSAAVRIAGTPFTGRTP